MELGNGDTRTTWKQNLHFLSSTARGSFALSSRVLSGPNHRLWCQFEDNETVYVLLDKSCRLYLYLAEPRIYGNVWQTPKGIILKGQWVFLLGVLHMPTLNCPRCLPHFGFRRSSWSRLWGDARFLVSTLCHQCTSAVCQAIRATLFR
jgi:hypothetical protein